MEDNGFPCLDLLAATPQILRGLMSEVSDQDARWKPAPDRFSIAEVLAGRRSGGLSAEFLLTNARPSAARSPVGDSLLHVAVYARLTNVMTTLLARGDDANATNAYGLTPLQYASVPPVASSGWRFPGTLIIPGGVLVVPPAAAGSVLQPQMEAVAALLLAGGAKLDAFSAAALGRTNELAGLLAQEPGLLTSRDAAGRTLLHWALLAGTERSAEWLIRRGAPVGEAMTGWPAPL